MDLRNLFLLSAFALVGCVKPLQGYSGPELPKEQVALVHGIGDSTDEKVEQLAVDGISFAGRDITLLPGVHRFKLIAGAGSPPRNCFDTDQTDTSAFDYCLDERSEQIRTKSAYVRDCDPDDFVTEKQKCQRDYNDYSCDLTLKLEAGRAYALRFYEALDEPRFYCEFDRGEDIGEQRETAATGKCKTLGTRTVVEEFDGHFY